jgi:hypothetical protein
MNTKGKWKVVRNCCTSGNCTHCYGARTGTGSLRVTQADGYSEEYAMLVASNWRRYAAVAVPMDVVDGSSNTPESKWGWYATEEGFSFINTHTHENFLRSDREYNSNDAYTLVVYLNSRVDA